MPRGRMLNKSISVDEEVAKLSEKAIILYTFCIPHLDVDGKILGNVNILKGVVVPYLKNFTKKKIGECVRELAESPLVLLYGSEHKYMQFLGFSSNQKINREREAPSEIPNPPPELLKSKSRLSPAEVKLNLSKDNKRPAPSAVELSTSSQQDKKIVQDFIAKDTSFGTGRTDNDFRAEVKDVCLCLARRCSDWGEPVEDEDKFVDKFFGLMSNLMRFGIAKKPKGVSDLKGNPTSKAKMIELIGRMSKPKNLVAELIDAVKKQPKYLP